MNAIDNVISFFNPEAGAKRARPVELEQVRRYDGSVVEQKHQLEDAEHLSRCSAGPEPRATAQPLPRPDAQ